MTDELKRQYAAALEETALAYFRKRDRIQYESSDMTYLHKFLGGPFRRTDGISPESATKDEPMFSVCSSFMYAVLWDACRYPLCGSVLHHFCLDIVKDYEAQTVYAYAEDGEVKPKRGFRECLEALKPGDFIIIRNPKADNYHVMLRISDERIIHCSGHKYEFKEGVEKWETFGAVRIDTIQNFFLDMLGVYPFHNFSHWWVVRILDAIDPVQYPLTPAALSRLKYPGLNIDRTASVRRYQTVQPGDTVTYTLRIRNENERDSKIVHENVTVEETIPAGTTLLESSLDGAVVAAGNKLRWTLTVHPLQEHTLQYSVRVNDNVEPGTEIVSEGGRVDDIPSCTIKTPVAKPRLSLSECARLSAVTEGKSASSVYETVLGKKVTIPAVQEVLDSLYDRVPVECMEDEDKEKYKDNVLLKRKAGAAHPAEAMMVPGMLGGMALGEVSQYDRILEFRSEYFCPGDVVLAAKELRKDFVEAEEMLILGGGKVVKTTAEGSTVEDLPNMDYLFAYDYFTVLRPYLAMGGNENT